MSKKDSDSVLQVVNVIKEMLNSRGYNDDDELTSYAQMSTLEFSSIYDQSIQNGLSFGPISHEVLDDNKIILKIIFNTTRKSNIKDICESFFTEHGENIKILIVMKDRITPNITKEITQNTQYRNVEIFQMKNLMINITKHVLQPKFEIIYPKDELNIVKQYISSTTITPQQINQFKSKLPKIPKDDPISKFYGLKSGNILKITRMNEQSGRYITFRCCN